MKGQWIKIDSPIELPEYQNGYIWKLKFEDGQEWWSALSQSAHQYTPHKRIVAYWSVPSSSNKSLDTST